MMMTHPISLFTDPISLSNCVHVSKWALPRAMMMTHLISLFTDPISLLTCMLVLKWAWPSATCVRTRTKC